MAVVFFLLKYNVLNYKVTYTEYILQDKEQTCTVTKPRPATNTGRQVQGGSNMTRTDLCANKPHCAAAVRP